MKIARTATALGLILALAFSHAAVAQDQTASQSASASSAASSSDDSSSASDDDMADLLVALGGQPKDIDARLAEAAKHPLGSRENPVRVDMPGGEEAYLRHLRCSDGKAPKYNRPGDVGMGVFGHILDVFDVTCRNAPQAVEIYMDMYFPDYTETQAPEGFTLKN